MKKQLLLMKVFFLVAAMAFIGSTYATQLSGNYTINPGAVATATNFKDFNSAVTYLTGSGVRNDGGVSNTTPFGVSGPVKFTVSAGTYTEQVTLTGAIAGSSATNTITFDGVNAATRILTGSYASAPTFKVSGQSYVTIKNLRVENLYAGTCSGIALIGNTTTNAGVGFTVKNCYVTVPNTGSTTSYGIIVTGSTTGVSDANQWTDSVTIDSNYVYGGYYGIQISTSANGNASYNRNHRIRYNYLDQTWYYGIRFYYIYNAADISYNTINMSSGNVSSYGLYFYYNQNATSGTFSKIIGNTITAGYAGIYFYYFTSPTGVTIPVYNNVFRTFGTSAYTGAYVYSGAAGANQVNFYHNTCIMTGASASYGLYYYNSAATGTSYFKNNIYAVAGSSSYPAYFSTNPTGNVVNYNNYYNAAGTNLVYRGSAYTASTYKTATAGGDSSFNVKPDFVSISDAHLKSACQPRGVDLSAFAPTDIDGNVRPASPLAGVHEKPVFTNDAGIDTYLYPVPPIAATSTNLAVRIKNFGSATLTSLNVSYTLNGSTPVTVSWTGSLASCDTATVIFNGSNQISLVNKNDIKVFTSAPNAATDGDKTNDSVRVTYYVPLSGNYTVGGSGADFANVTEAADAIKSGVSGPVYITMNAGTYTGQVTIQGPVVGASAVNTITFDGVNAATRIVTGNSAGTAAFLVNQASYVTIRNLTVTNLAGGGCAGIALVGNTTNNAGVGFTVKNCVVNLPNVGSATSYGVIITGSTSGTSDANQWADSVTVDSNTINGGYYGIQISTSGNLNASYNRGHRIRYNNINAYYYGIRFYYIANPADISYNNIKMDSTNASSYGIYFYYNQYGSAVASSKIIANKVYAGYAGLYYYYATNTAAYPTLIFNNMFTIFGASGYTGMYVYTGATGGMVTQIYHNSVNVLGASASYGLYYYNSTGSLTASNIKNNIFTVAGSSTYPVYLSTNPTGNVINYNNYYNAAGGTLVYRGSAFTAANYKTSSAGGDTSYNVNPNFTVNGYEMRLQDACAPQGVDLTATVPVDIDGEVRPAPPRIGADEYNGLVNDIAIDKLITPAAPVTSGLQDVVVRIKNMGSNTITGFNVTYKNNTSTAVVMPWTGTLNPCDTVSVIFTGTNRVNIGASNNFVIYTSAPNALPDAKRSNDTLRAVFLSPLNGAYTIGATGSFATFTDAATALTNAGISGPVNFTVLPGTFTEQVSLNGPVIGSSATNTITFDGINAATRILTSNTNAPTLKINGQSYVTIKNLTVNNTYAGSCAGIACIGNTSTNTGVGFTVKRCIVNLPNTATSTSYGVIVTGSTAGISDANQFTDSVTIDSNTINGGYYGIQVSTSGNLNTAYNRGHRIRYNTLNNTYYYGIRFYYIANPGEISYNIINMDPTNSSSYGIYFYYNQYGSATASSKIIGNKVYAGYAGLYYYYATNTAAYPTLIYNNMFNVFGASAYVGMYVYTGATGGMVTNVYHNTVNMQGASASYGLYYYNSTGSLTASMIKNNIFSVAGLGTYPAYFSTAPTGNVVNYNNYYNAGGTTLLYRGSAFTNTTYKTAAAGGDSSFNQNPLFVSTSDLHSYNACTRGVDLTANVPADIDGNVRSVTPAVGAHETSGLLNDISVDKVYFNTPVVSGLQDISVRIKNNSPSTTTSFNISYKLNSGSVVTMAWTGSMAGCGDTAFVTFTGSQQANLALGSNVLKVYTSNPNGGTDNNKSNDTMLVAMTTITKVSGNALVMNGVSGFTTGSTIRFNSRPEMIGNSTTAFTAEVWVKLTTNTTDQKFICKSNVNNGFCLGILGTGNKFDPEIWTVANGTSSVRMTSTGVSMANNIIPANTWTHLAVTWQSGVGVKAYINGSLVGYLNSTVTTTLSQSATDFYLGADSWDYGYPTFGSLDEVRLWNVALDSVSIRRNMHRTLSGTEPGLTTYIQLNEGSSSTLFGDVIGGATGTRNAAAVLAASTAPLGGDSTLVSNYVTSGSFANGAASLYLNDPFDFPVDLTITEIPYAPNVLPVATHNYVNNYWIIQPFGNAGTFSADLNVQMPFGYLNTTDTSVRLYKRGFNDDGAWVFYKTASAVYPNSVTFTGVDTLGQFTIASNGSSPLPVSLISFGAKRVNETVKLNWQTASELNCRGFEVERSYNDADHFESIGFVNAAGNNAKTLTSYVYNDMNTVVHAAIYYRLKQVDMDGKYAYSPVAVIAPKVDAGNSVLVYPNPFNTEFNVNIHTTEAGVANVQIIDITGKAVYTAALQAKQGNNSFMINDSSLKAGIYFVSVEINGEVQTLKINKQ